MNGRLVKMGQMVGFVVLMVALTVGGGFAGERVDSSIEKSGGSAIDYKNAKPLPLPKTFTPAVREAEDMAIEYPGEPAFEPGSRGTGGMSPVTIPAPMAEEMIDEIIPHEYGTKNHPFTTSRVDVLNTANAVSKLYPFRAAGKLYFKIGTGTYICSASLIKKGIVVTAAHCVTEFGKNNWFTGFQYIPALWGTTAPYGTWNVTAKYAISSYRAGTDVCSTAGVVCKNDVAVLVITPKNGVYPGTTTGWFGYGVNGYGFAPTAPKTALINQLGYPGSHDSGIKMQRTDSEGFVSSAQAGNTVWGSRQTGGSSGGPELVNLGAGATLDAPVVLGSGAAWNTVVGVTSWGYTDQVLKQQGASPFLSTNITALVNAACAAYPAACAP